jgi:hypothetical protein
LVVEIDMAAVTPLGRSCRLISRARTCTRGMLGVGGEWERFGDDANGRPVAAVASNRRPLGKGRGGVCGPFPCPMGGVCGPVLTAGGRGVRRSRDRVLEPIGAHSTAAPAVAAAAKAAPTAPWYIPSAVDV